MKVCASQRSSALGRTCEVRFLRETKRGGGIYQLICWDEADGSVLSDVSFGVALGRVVWLEAKEWEENTLF